MKLHKTPWMPAMKRDPFQLKKLYYGSSFSEMSATNHLGVGVGTLLLAEGGNHVDEATVVLDAALGAARLLLLLLLFVHLHRDDRADVNQLNFI